MKRTWFVFMAILLLAAGAARTHSGDAAMRIAFMPDVHFHDVYADLGDEGFSGVANPKNGRNAFIRTMYAQLTSTRLFNENYFVFFAALDDAAARGLTYIVLPGDFTDDGQPVHTVAVKEILDDYAQRYGMVFLATNGNHDPYKPYGRPSGKKDFLGADGSEQRVYSRGMRECRNYPGSSAIVDTGDGLPVACTEVIRELGYAEIGGIMADFGFMPRPEYAYWETPFSTYDESGYDYETARLEARWENRSYEICLEGAGGDAKKPEYSVCAPVPDSSYLVELDNDVWLMVIDANIYRIAKNAEHVYPTYPGLFEGSSSAGYNFMKDFKPHVLDWMRSVAKRAQARGKRLVATSHFPMTDYYGGIGPDLAALFGKGKLQTGRLPSEDTMRMLAETGVNIHVGGHMHVNSTSSVRYGDDFLVNIQSPSPSSYVSGYKIMTLHEGDRIEVETVQLDAVPRFDELFDLYRMEHALLAATGSKKLWDADILQAKTFREYCDRYFRELTRLRFIPGEWPADMRSLLTNVQGRDLLTLSQLPAGMTFGAFVQASGGPLPGAAVAMAECLPEGEASPHSASIAAEWERAREAAAEKADEAGMRLDDFAWDGFELMVDFHRILNAGELALPDIPAGRMAQYAILAEALAVPSGNGLDVPASGKEIPAGIAMADWARIRIGGLLQSMFSRLAADPSDHFMIDYRQKTVTRID